MKTKLLSIIAVGACFLTFPLISKDQWTNTATEVRLDGTNDAKSVHIEDTGTEDGITPKLQVTTVGTNGGFMGTYYDNTASFTSKVSGTSKYYKIAVNNFNATGDG